MDTFLDSRVKNRNINVSNLRMTYWVIQIYQGNFCRHVRVPLCYCTVWEQRAFAQKGLYSAWAR